MPMNKSMAKRLRQSEKRRLCNRAVKTTVVRLRRRAHEAIHSGDPESAQAACRAAVRGFDKAVSKGVLHKKTAARRKSRLMRDLAALAEEEELPASEEEAESQEDELESEEEDEDSEEEQDDE